MRMPPLLTVAMLAFLLGLSSSPVRSAPGVTIPDFTPNVVDAASHLDAPDTARVNLELQRIRDENHVWGAVFIVDTLGDDAIEDVAVRAFEKWQLGQKGVDNGLLLVLAIDDRKSRFEVGYGLEGPIPDVAALHALDTYLAPKMREGDTAGAIVDAFGYLARLVAKDPDAQRELADIAEAEAEGKAAWVHAGIALEVYLAALWLCVPLRNAWVLGRRRRLLEEHPTLALRDDEVVKSGDSGGRWKLNLFMQGFLSLNPGLFVFVGAGLEPAAYPWVMIAPVVLMLLLIYGSGRKYGSEERYRKHLDSIASQRAELIRKGHVVETSPGVFGYTPAYHASRASSSSSSSSSGSSYSSSSGGGRSGGGGASSGW